MRFLLFLQCVKPLQQLLLLNSIAVCEAMLCGSEVTLDLLDDVCGELRCVEAAVLQQSKIKCQGLRSGRSESCSVVTDGQAYPWGGDYLQYGERMKVCEKKESQKEGDIERPNYGPPPSPRASTGDNKENSYYLNNARNTTLTDARE